MLVLLKDQEEGASNAMSLTEINYEKGFLMDESWMGGISRNPTRPEEYLAFIINHEDGSPIAQHECTSLTEALLVMNSVKRDWKFEGSSSCGGCQTGKCNTGACHKLNSSYENHNP
ncbi:MAG: hypothetical protein KA715_11685 [Xanthomonadaceae bacterium]|nr:hypothetical protein [Xanthomonadaceae bacterium]